MVTQVKLKSKRFSFINEATLDDDDGVDVAHKFGIDPKSLEDSMKFAKSKSNDGLDPKAKKLKKGDKALDNSNNAAKNKAKIGESVDVDDDDDYAERDPSGLDRSDIIRYLVNAGIATKEELSKMSMNKLSRLNADVRTGKIKKTVDDKDDKDHKDHKDDKDDKDDELTESLNRMRQIAGIPLQENNLEENDVYIIFEDMTSPKVLGVFVNSKEARNYLDRAKKAVAAMNTSKKPVLRAFALSNNGV